MSIGRNEKIAEVADEIYQYLCADTIEGVAQWWLLHEQYIRKLKLVENALELLLDKGVIEIRINPDGQVIY